MTMSLWFVQTIEDLQDADPKFNRLVESATALTPDVDLPNVRLGAILPGQAEELPGCAVEIVVGLAPAAVSKARV